MHPLGDDADLVYFIEDQERILALKDEFALYGLHLTQDVILRLRSSPVEEYPYIDLSGYRLCGDNAYRFDLEGARKFYFHTFYWLRQEVTPLVKVPFGPLLLPAPNDMIRYVLTGYGKDCLSHAIFQKHHGGKNKQSIPQKVRIVDFRPAAYEITDFTIPLD